MAIDEDRPLEQVALDGPEHLIDQVGPPVDHVDLDAGGEELADVLHRGVERQGDVARVLSHPHEGEAEDHLSLALGGGAAPADRVADGRPRRRR